MVWAMKLQHSRGLISGQYPPLKARTLVAWQFCNSINCKYEAGEAGAALKVPHYAAVDGMMIRWARCAGLSLSLRYAVGSVIL